MGTAAMLWLGIGVACWLAFALVCRVLARNPRGTVDAGLFLVAARVYARLVHRLRVKGRENVPPSGPLRNGMPGPADDACPRPVSSL